MTLKDAALINGVAGVAVSYFVNENDALNKMDEIIGLFQNTSNPQTVWARLESIDGGCFGVEQFQLEIFDTPITVQPPNMILCDDDNNGTMPFDLILQNGIINSDPGILISYHLTQNDHIRSLSVCSSR